MLALYQTLLALFRALPEDVTRACLTELALRHGSAEADIQQSVDQGTLSVSSVDDLKIFQDGFQSTLKSMVGEINSILGRSS